VFKTSKLSVKQYFQLENFVWTNEKCQFWDEHKTRMSVTIMSPPENIRDLIGMFKHSKIHFKVVIKDLEE
jgi:hypothetical protein